MDGKKMFAMQEFQSQYFKKHASNKSILGHNNRLVTIFLTCWLLLRPEGGSLV